MLVPGLSGCSVATSRPREAERMAEFAVVIRGGRLIDPGQGLDTSEDLAIEDAHVAAIGTGLRGRIVLDATGCVVAPGFVDLHSHAQSVGAHRLQAFDGVTTTLELEAGALPVAAAYTRAGVEGRPLNYGYSASWAGARIEVLTGHRGDRRATTMLPRFADPAWQREATPAEEDRILGLLEGELAAGGLGIGVLLGYAAGTSPGEYLRVARLAAAQRVPTYTHARALVEFAPYAHGRGRGARARRGRDRCPHALLPRQQHLGAPRGPGSRPGRPGAPRGGGRHHRGVSVRRRDDGDRGRVPRPRAAGPGGSPPDGHRLRADERTGTRRRAPAGACALPIRVAAASCTSSTRRSRRTRR